MKYLIVGLGNPGDKYVDTRHNIGFKVVEEFVRQQEGSFSPDRLADVAKVKFKGRTMICIKPTTFMNLSGKALNYWMQAEKIPLENVLVITDDIALPYGKLRMKRKGSDGGHNGLKDIIAVLGRSDFPRLRFGVGADFAKGRQVDYVLGTWNAEELSILTERIETSTEFIKAFCTIGVERAMNTWNNK